MKNLLLITSLCCLFSFRSFSQQSTSKCLIGTWIVNDTTNHLPPMSLTFTDSMHVKLSIQHEGSAPLTYSIAIYHNQLVLHFEGLDFRNAKKHMYWFIKILDDKTIEAEEPLYSPKSYKWSDDLAITMVKQNDHSVAMH